LRENAGKVSPTVSKGVSPSGRERKSQRKVVCCDALAALHNGITRIFVPMNNLMACDRKSR
jgi:hypothetical protein